MYSFLCITSEIWTKFNHFTNVYLHFMMWARAYSNNKTKENKHKMRSDLSNNESHPLKTKKWEI